MLAFAASLLTARRVRAHGFLLALCLWVIYAWNIATPGLRDRAGNLKGTDFLHLYTLGSLALAHRGADLYDMQAQAALAAQRVPAAAGIRYLPLYPPQVSILFASFAQLSYGWGLVLWLLVSAAIYASCAYALWRACPSLRGEGRTVLILAIAFPAFWHLIAWGQTSALALACFTLAFFALRNERDFLGGTHSRMPDLQAATGCRGRRHLHGRAPMEIDRRRSALSLVSVCRRMALLRRRPTPRLDRCSSPLPHPVIPAGTEALSNSFFT